MKKEARKELLIDEDDEVFVMLKLMWKWRIPSSRKCYKQLQ